MFKNKPRRIYLEDHVYFVTAKTFNNKKIFENNNYANIFLSSLKFLFRRGDFEIYNGILLPDHFHLILKPMKKNISEIMHDLKSYSAQKINQHRRGIPASPTIIPGEAGSLTYNGNINLSHAWQRSFYYHVIGSEKDFENHFEYIYYNAIQHGYVDKPEDWAYYIGFE